MRAPNATSELRRQTDAARALLTAYDDILGDDAEARRDTVEGETGLHEALRAGIARMAELTALRAGVDHHLGLLEERRNRYRDQDARLRAAMLQAMEVGGLRKLETPLGTVSLRAVPPSVVVTDETTIPPGYFVPQLPKLDKVAVKNALKAGITVPGAELSNGGTTLAVKLT